MNFQQIRDFVNPQIAQATGMQPVDDLQMPVPVAHIVQDLVIDGQLSETSENPVQNKVITHAINEILEQFEGGIEEAVDNWLDDNPQATTTVQDGAITYAKLDSNLKAKADEVTELKNALQAYEGGTTGQILRKKSNADNDVEWSDVGTPTDEQVQNAVDDYLDAHPEQTTTVVDGSLTEAKFTDATLSALKNDYVTPEMFGAKGDGTTDDTLSIQQMFASNNTVFKFGNKVYLVNGSIDVDKACEIYFDKTTLKVSQVVGKRSFEYIIGFKHTNIYTYGELVANGQKSVNICIWLGECGNSHFGTLTAVSARIWGVYLDRQTNNNTNLKFDCVNVSQCGYKVTAKAKRASNDTLDISNISLSMNSQEYAADLFGNQYRQARFVIDDSGYSGTLLHNRFIFYNQNDSYGFTFNEEDLTTATFKLDSPGPKVPSDYTQNDATRNVFIPIGGGFSLESKNSEGPFLIHRLSSASNPLSSFLGQGYGGSIDIYETGFDTVVIHNECLNVAISYMYAEGVGDGFSYKFQSGYDRIYAITQTYGTYIYVSNLFIGQNRIPFVQGNAIGNYYQASYDTSIVPAISCPDYLAVRKLPGKNINRPGIDRNFSYTVDENSPRNITIDAEAYVSTGGVTINLQNEDVYRSNGFEPLFLYVRRRTSGVNYDDFAIKLSTALINSGYTINGAIDNVLVIHPSDYSNFVKITITLFMSNKKFYVTAEQMQFVSNAT